MTSLADQTPGTRHDARKAAAVLIALLDSIEGDPEFATLRDEAFWSIRGSAGPSLMARLYATYTEDKPLQLLELWRARFGGTVAATGERYTDNFAWHALTTAYGDVPVTLKVPVPKPDVEKQLRARIAELEAQVDGQDRPLPYALTDRSAGGGDDR